MIQIKNTNDKQTFYIPKTTMETEFVSGYEAKDVSIARNGTYKVVPGFGKKALSAVNLDVNVKLEGQDKEVTYKENGSYTINADEGYPGLNTVEVEVNIDTDTYFDRGYAVGAKEQRAKLGAIDITENGAYYKADGYKEINVNVPEVTFSTQSKEVTCTDNGEYTVTPDEGYDGIKEVKVTVDIDTSNAPFMVPLETKLAYSTFTKIPDNWDWSNFKTAKDCSQIFMNCPNLVEAPKIPFRDATHFTQLFYGCYKLKSIDASLWDTSNLKNLSNAFAGTLIEENPQIDTSNATNFNYAFYDCEELRRVRNLNTSKATNMNCMFDGCTMLNTVDELDLSSMTSNFSSGSSLFYGCWGLRNFGGFKGLKVNMYLDQCHSLSYESLMNVINKLEPGVSNKTLYLTYELVDMLSDDDIAIATGKGWRVSPTKRTSNPVLVASMDDVNSSAYRIDMNSYDFSQFNGDWGNSYSSTLPNADRLCVFEGDLSSTTDAQLAFGYCYNLRALKLTGTGNITDMSHMLSDCEKLCEANLKDWDVSNVTTMEGMFYDVGDFDADFSTWDVSNVTNFDDMFYLTKIKNVDMSNWKPLKSTRMENMFSNSDVENVIFGDISNVYTMDSIFIACDKLKSVTMTSPLYRNLSVFSMFFKVETEGTFYYNPAYDYSKIISELPATWKAIPLS